MKEKEKLSYFGLSFLASLIFIAVAYTVYAINYVSNSLSDPKLVDARENNVLEASDSASGDSLY